MNNELYGLQKDTYNRILDNINNGENKIIVQFPSQMGKNKIILALLDYFKNQRILIVCSTLIEVQQYKNSIFSDSTISRVFLTTADSIPAILNFDIIIVDNTDYQHVKIKVQLLKKIDNQFCILFSDSISDNTFYENFKLISCVNNNYPISDEFSVIKHLYIPLLEKIGFENIEENKKYKTNLSIRPDISAKKNGTTYIFETKQYRSRFNNIQLTKRAINQINYYKKAFFNYSENNYKFVLIILCEIQEDFKQTQEQENDIIILDIKNLLYLCGSDSFLISQLQKYVYYSLDNISKIEPLIDFGKPIKFIEENPDNRISTELIDKINNCTTGKNYYKQYETICYDVINYLFDNDFSQITNQHSTEDKMFRMDILCSIKSTKEFWRFLMQFYHTKFVVFESKNYSEKIEQNLIYVTEKYLYDSALRNVAFIISRKGFDDNAQKAAIGILREHNKLIIDITDMDLINMINDKNEGKEPTDYLFNKVEAFLMGISK